MEALVTVPWAWYPELGLTVLVSSLPFLCLPASLASDVQVALQLGCWPPQWRHDIWDTVKVAVDTVLVGGKASVKVPGLVGGRHIIDLLGLVVDMLLQGGVKVGGFLPGISLCSGPLQLVLNLLPGGGIGILEPRDFWASVTPSSPGILALAPCLYSSLQLWHLHLHP